jgi:heme oxygenase
MEVTAQKTHMEKIKAGIWDIHDGVSAQQEKPQPQGESIMTGTLPLFKYVSSLKQRYLLQKAFEEILAAHRQHPDLAAVVTDDQFHADKAAQDLRFFAVDPAAVTLLPTTHKMINFFQESARRDPRLLLAIHYVIEGSNNGAVFIAKAVKKAYNLEGTDGTYHLQPYGNAIRDKWKAFADSFNARDFDDALMTEMIHTGRQTFHQMNAVANEAYNQPEAI